MLVLILGLATTAAMAAQDRTSRIDLFLNADEALAVLAILDKQNAQQPVTDADWQHLFSTEPYVPRYPEWKVEDQKRGR